MPRGSDRALERPVGPPQEPEPAEPDPDQAVGGHDQLAADPISEVADAAVFSVELSRHSDRRPAVLHLPP